MDSGECQRRQCPSWADKHYGLVAGALVTQAIGAAEREAALALVDGLKAKGRITLGRTAQPSYGACPV